jgi:hypothetical protein
VKDKILEPFRSYYDEKLKPVIILFQTCPPSVFTEAIDLDLNMTP